MSKRNELNNAVRNLIDQIGVGYLFSEQQIDKIISQLSGLDRGNREQVKGIITNDIIVKSLVDFGDTEYWLDRIVDIINDK